MFGLFGKKKKSVKVYDKIWMSEEAKFKACIQLKQSNSNVAYIAWFEETKKTAQNYFNTYQLPDTEIYLANHLNQALSGKQIIFIEHHPLQTEEENIAQQLGLSEIVVYSALTEPIFKMFRSKEIIEMLKKMGLAADEMIEHSLISSSIKNAQQKIASKTTVNISARSQADWLLNAGFTASLI